MKVLLSFNSTLKELSKKKVWNLKNNYAQAVLQFFISTKLEQLPQVSCGMIRGITTYSVKAVIQNIVYKI